CSRCSRATCRSGLVIASTGPGLETFCWLRKAAWCRDQSVGAEELSGVGERPFRPFLPWIPIVPFKLNQPRRHHIPRQRHKVTN
ncbi:MAG: hypothetical protein M3380_03960, partial [Chloroflexota bacterium]|nr:hypothetical protein [Chloroflexota bacterium]